MRPIIAGDPSTWPFWVRRTLRQSLEHWEIWTREVSEKDNLDCFSLLACPNPDDFRPGQDPVALLIEHTNEDYWVLEYKDYTQVTVAQKCGGSSQSYIIAPPRTQLIPAYKEEDEAY